MKINNVVFLLAVIFAAVGCQFSCTQPTAGSETTSGNGYSLTVHGDTVFGETTPSGEIVFCSIHYNPQRNSGVTKTFKSDTSGRYRFVVENPDRYNVYFNNNAKEVGAYILNLAVPAVRNSPDSVTPMENRKSIHGKVLLDGNPVLSASVYIYGSPFITKTDASGLFLFNKIPDALLTVEALYEVSGVKYQFTDSEQIVPSNGNGAIVLELKQQIKK
jgi:hypothetical protein